MYRATDNGYLSSTDDDISDDNLDDDVRAGGDEDVDDEEDDEEDEYYRRRYDVYADDPSNVTIVDSAHSLTVHDLPLLRRGLAGAGAGGGGMDGRSSSPRLMSTSFVATSRRLEASMCGSESAMSDYSEIAAPLQEHLANMHMHQLDCRLQNGMYADGDDCGEVTDDSVLVQQPGECDEDFERRTKKVNYLSLAQEFAALKRVDPSAQPFSAIQQQQQQDRGDVPYSAKTEARSCSDYSVSSSSCDSVTSGHSAASASAATPLASGSSGGSGYDFSVVAEKLSNVEHSPSVDSGVVEPPSEYRDNVVAKTPPPSPAASGESAQPSNHGLSNAPSHSLTQNGDDERRFVPLVSATRSPARSPLHTSRLSNSVSGKNNSVVSVAQTASPRRKISAAHDADVNSIETALPQMDWDRLEKAIVKNSPAKIAPLLQSQVM